MNNQVADHKPVDWADEKFARRRRRRAMKDQAAKVGIGFGGVSVIIAILLIFVYLLSEVAPLFRGATIEQATTFPVPSPELGETVMLTMEEQADVGLRLTDQGQAIFFNTQNGRVDTTIQLEIPGGNTITTFVQDESASGLFAYGLDDGRVLLARHKYRITYPDDQRLITPYIDYPYGVKPLELADESLQRLAVRDQEERLVIAATGDSGSLYAINFNKEEDFLTEEVVLEPETYEMPVIKGGVKSLAIDIYQKSLFVVHENSRLLVLALRDGEARIRQDVVVADGHEIKSLEFLVGGISLLVGGKDGGISQWFLVRDPQRGLELTKVRAFSMEGGVQIIEPEHRRKGFAAANSRGEIGLFHTTAHRSLLVEPVTDKPITALGISPRANALLVEDAAGKMTFWEIENEHPEISWSSLWGKVWYESYPKPDYVWQSSASNNDFEPKLSLVPLTFGTIKAAFYAMLLAAPLAICGAIYTAHFMAPRMRRKVKPLIEVMEALPTVILGFLAGLWLAPFIEGYLPGIFSLLVLTPIGILAASFVWAQLPADIRHKLPEGWDAAVLIPVIILMAWLSISLSGTLENLFFGGDMRSWLSNDAGISFDQRNALVVGLAMGFAVIPTIFSIAEDAIFSVPKHLSNGSLALGATPWQTLTRVVILTASPGIFSALMIGFGRAVGETMIVLMATGNTPIMDWNIFEGMRTLAANIAVEMPESEVGSTHFRVLFLAALVLFMFTFFVNTLAEIVRQRLRGKYGSL